MARTRLLLTVASFSLLAGCTQDFNKFLTGTGGATSSGSMTTTTSSTMTTTSTGMTSSSSGVQCTPGDTSKCPPPSDDCHQQICNADGTCGESAKMAHAVCMSAPGPGVCDPTQMPVKCIGCIDATDCPMGSMDTCPTTTHVCTGPGCTDMVLNGTETDVDCGGGACPKCDNTKLCKVGSDCKSGFCTTTMGKLKCEPCAQQSDCAAADYCDTTLMGGTCVTKKMKGDACTTGNNFECSTNNCVEGVCCDNACAGSCSSCLAANTGGTNGTCGNVSAGGNPKAGACTAGCDTGKCDGAGACAVKAMSTLCGASPTCADNTHVQPQGTCNGTSGNCNVPGPMACAPNFSCTGNACNATCTMNAQCATGFLCDQNGGALNGTCHVCVSNASSPAAGCMAPTPACNLTTDTCVQCIASANCSGGTPVCNTSTNTCVQCLASGDCSGGTPVCKTATNTCVQCLANSDCSGGTPKCKTSTNACVQCLTNADCPGGMPTCSASNTCV